jgi:hypothetical protein
LRVEVEEEAGVDEKVGDCPVGLAFCLSFVVRVTGRLSCLENHPELWDIQKRGGGGKDREIVEKEKKKKGKDQHTTTKINKVVRSASANLSRDGARKTLGVDRDAQQTGSGHEGMADPESHVDVRKERRLRQNTVKQWRKKGRKLSKPKEWTRGRCAQAKGAE